MMSRPWTVKFLAAAMSLAAAFCLAVSASAAMIVNDTWQDGERNTPASPTYSENGVDADADGDIESAWFRGGAGTFDPVGLGGPLRGTGYAGSSASWTTYFTPEASPVTLASAGNQIKLTWEFTTGDVNASNSNQNFRFALIDSATRLVANGSPSGNATGYAMFANMGETLGQPAGQTPFQLKERSGQGAILSAGADWSTNLGSDGTAGNTGYADNTKYTFVWTITRNAIGNLDIVAKMSGGNLNGVGSLTATTLNTAPNGGAYTFDTFTLRPSSATTTTDTFDTSLLRVEFVVPEPTTFALLSLGGFVLVGLGRRR